MLRRRKILVAVCVALIPGSIAAALGFALHLRSASYRESLAARLSERLGMSVEIGRIRPLSLQSKALERVSVSLGNGGDQVFAGNRVVWSTMEGRGSRRYVLDLADGWLKVGSRAWTAIEYQRLLSGGFRHDFVTMGLAEVRLKDIDLRFTHPSMDFRAGGSSGLVLFEEDGTGQAALNCTRLNGVQVAEPINIAARFIPGEQWKMQEIRLAVPTIAVGALGIENLLRHEVSSGEFAGSVVCRETPGGTVLSVEGALLGAKLDDFTTQLPGGPYHGTLDIDVDEAVIARRALRKLDAHGRLSGVRLDQVLPRLARAATAAPLTVQVDQVRVLDGRLAYLSARAQCNDVPTEALSTLLGHGTITGSARLNVASLTVVDEVLRYADVTIAVVPPPDAPGLIDRQLIGKAAQAWLGMDVAAAFPEQVEYTQLGVRLVLDEGELEVLGTHGLQGRAILTIKLLGREWEAVSQPDQTFEVPDLLALLRSRAEDLELEEVRSWWEWLHAEDSSTPE